MIPSRQVWKSWSPLEKISYGAQFAASLALLPTVLFAYLGWREARISREDQTEFFLAEKAPRLEVKNIHIDTGVLMVDIQNSGESLARDVRVTNIAAIVGGSIGSVTFDQLPKEFYGADGHMNLVVAKNQSISVPLESTLEIEKKLGYIPWGLKVSNPNDREVALDGTALLLVTVTYRDVRQGEYGTMASALMKPPKYPAQLAEFLRKRSETERLPTSAADSTAHPIAP